MMGGQCSETRNGDASSPLPMNDTSRYMADLSSYEAACRTDPDLQSFNAAIQARATQLLDCQQEINQDAVKFILKSAENVWKNKEMFKLVEKYFDNNLKTFEFCDALQSFLRRTRDSQMINRLAVKQFEEEVKNGEEGKYVEELRKFKEAGNPIIEGFVKSFQLVYEHQLSLFNHVREEKRKLDKKLKSYTTGRRVSNVIFIAAKAVRMGFIGKLFNTRSKWNRCIKEVEGQRKLLSSVHVCTFIVLQDFQTISLVCRLEEMIFSMLESTKSALREEDPGVKLVIEEIEKKREEFNRAIDLLFQHADKCRQEVMRARTVILHHICTHLNEDDDQSH